MEEGSKGAILADEMGLGKTIQALALILSRPSSDRLRKVCCLEIQLLLFAKIV
jgi:SNF2 family DNA or RNA helicase